ncbi:MAG TPA: hypothetical protein VM582_07470 [Candidatus Thermoplasmatota archaeon]|nr:hypothetical protein [Candidatus Thermoplasmatota archaeon]
MTLVWNVYALPAILGGLISVFLGARIHFAAPPTLRSRALVATLVFGGAGMGTFYGVRLLAADPATAYALLVLGFALIMLMVSAYALWTTTLESPIAAPLARPPARAALVALALGATLHLVLRPRTWFPDLRRFELMSAWIGFPGPARTVALLGFLVVLVVGALVTFDAWRRARSDIARRQMRINGVTNLVFCVGTTAYVVRALGTQGIDNARDAFINFYGAPSLLLTFNAGLAYGMLKTHLFDVDLRLKRGINRGTVVAIFLGGFLLAVEAAKEFLSESLGVVVGAIAVGILALAFRPIEAAAERLASTALPRVQDTLTYAQFRKMEVYKAALEEFAREGGVTARERRALDALRARLGVAEADARAMETELELRQAAA